MRKYENNIINDPVEDAAKLVVLYEWPNNKVTTWTGVSREALKQAIIDFNKKREDPLYILMKKEWRETIKKLMDK